MPNEVQPRPMSPGLGSGWVPTNLFDVLVKIYILNIVCIGLYALYYTFPYHSIGVKGTIPCPEDYIMICRPPERNVVHHKIRKTMVYKNPQGTGVGLHVCPWSQWFQGCFK